MRAEAWRVLSALLLDGLTDATLPTVRSVEPLAAALPDPLDADEAAAEHHRLFGLEVFPYASVFLERSGRLGGAVSDSAGRLFDRCGVPRPGSSEAPDHLGHELALLAVLTERDDVPRVGDLLEGHLLWWLPVFVDSAERHASPFWSVVLRLVLDAALDQRAGLPATRAVPEPPGALAMPAEDPLADEERSLRRLARHAVVPARGGIFLSLSDIRGLGRERDLPGGFGRREQVLTNLLRSAAGYGELRGTVGDLQRLIAGQRAFLGSIPAPFRDPWMERLGRLDALLDALRVRGG